MSFAWSCASLLLLAALLVACNGDSGEEPFFPEDYQSAYVLTTECRRSVDHDLRFVEIYTSPDGVDSYVEQEVPFPVGSVVVKEEYDDQDCTERLDLTAMRKEVEGEPDDVDRWSFQRVTLDHQVVRNEDLARCASCHRSCFGPLGFDNVCTREE